MKIIPAILFFSLLLIYKVPRAQNLVANPSFEELSGCPDDFFQIYKAPPWFSPNCEPLRPDRHGYAILFTGKNPCNTDLTGVPKNIWCHQLAHSGSGYAGIEVVSARTLASDYRQYLETQLQQPLIGGKRYLFSMFYNLCYSQPVSSSVICFKTDSLGAHFSQTIIDKNRNCELLPVAPQVYGESKLISPSPVWHQLSGCVTANGNEKYLTIGNFGGDPFSNCAAVDSIGYYLFIDDVSVISEVTKDFDTVSCSGNGWKVNAKELRREYATLAGWNYQWSDGRTEMERQFATPGNYTLKVTNQNCFTDTYHFKIGFVDCSCQPHIPNAFTPDGDSRNDKFIPHLNCPTQQVSEYRFSIFNRWGMRIFFSSSQTEAWDGTFKGRPVTTGQYIYLLEYKAGLSQPLHKVKGTVSVLR